MKTNEMRTCNINPQAAERLRQEAAEREAEAESTFEAQKEALSTVVEELLELAFDSRRRFASMQETLVNHKREVFRLVSWLSKLWSTFVFRRLCKDPRGRRYA